MKTLPGKITIGRVHGGEKDYVSITIVDANSILQLAEVEMDFAEFGEAITGMGRVGCTIFFNDSQNIGKKHEVKTQIVRIPISFSVSSQKKEAIGIVLQKYEVDGWVADIDSALNHHNWRGELDGMRNVEVTFRRWV